MKAKATPDEVDPVLAPFFAEADEAKALYILSDIVKQHVEPKVSLIVSALLPEARVRDDLDSEGLCSEIVLKLIQRIYELKSRRGDAGFRDLSTYVAATSRNACHSYLRAKYPERTKLKNRIRYALDHDRDMAVWRDTAGAWLCGLGTWRNRSGRPFPRSRLETLLRSGELNRLLETRGSERNPAVLIGAVFKATAAPVRLDDLVSAIAELSGINERETLSLGSILDFAKLDSVTGSAAPESHAIESVVDVARLWREIVELPVRQRLVLLLTMKDERGLDGLSLLGNARAASLDEVSLALEIDAMEIARMWDELPLPDSAVAEKLGITTQQVVNLRKSARKRLAYRLRDFVQR